jgi:LPS-assembly lipoprotein
MQKTHDLSKHVRGGVLALALTVMVSGCGFSPVYSTGGSNVGPVFVEQIDGRAGYFLRQELDRHAVLEQGTEAPRTLSVKLLTSFASASMGVDGLSARTLYTMTANYTLKPSVAENTPISGIVTITVGYESLDQAYGDVALQADAEERAATQIADKVWADLRRQARARK